MRERDVSRDGRQTWLCLACLLGLAGGVWLTVRIVVGLWGLAGWLMGG